jgi:hypothetical protein
MLGHQPGQGPMQARALFQNVGNFLLAVLDRVLPAPSCPLGLIPLLQQMRHDALELRPRRPLVALGQTVQLLDQIRDIERGGNSSTCCLTQAA